MVLLLPVWLLAGWTGFAHPASAKHKESSRQETKLSKVVAAPVAVLQVQAPSADFDFPADLELTYALLPADVHPQPLKTGGNGPIVGFGHRYYNRAIASRAP